MRLRSKYVLIALAGLLTLSASAQEPATTQDAAAPADDDTWTIGEINFSGLFDGYYQWANNHPASGFTTLRNFEVTANSYNVNMIEFSMSHEADPIGFRVDLGWGKAWDIFNSFDNPKTSSYTRFIQQAYVTIAPPKVKGLTIDFGRFFTSAGAELTENNYTWTYGRGWVYTNGPYYHMGLRLSQALSDHFKVGFQLVNGWNNMVDNNSGKTMGFTTALEFDKISWYNTLYSGPEQTGTNKGFRNFYDTVLNLNPSDKAQFYINYDYGHDAALGASWWVIGVAGHTQLNEHNALTFRYEYYDDKDGWLGLGGPVVLQSYTATYEYKFKKGLATRLEWRTDTADTIPVFEKGFGNAKNQSTLTLGFIAFFGK